MESQIDTPNKARKLNGSQTPSSSRLKPRRAARACESCRNSKLRCQAPENPSHDARCGHCAKMSLVCRYAVPAPPESAYDDTPFSRPSADVERIAHLERNVADLMTKLEGRADMMEGGPAAAPVVNYLSTLADYATSRSTELLSAETDWSNPLAMSNDNNYTFDQSQQLPNIVISPDAPSDGARSHHTTGDKLAPSQARPIPQVAAASRMAAFTEPSSHEAPFRSLTFNPDTFRNSELSRAGSEDRAEPSLSWNGDAGRKTPKRGGGDPIDRGILHEAQARALFDLFRLKIHFFLPILQEPINFDSTRHRSSFLLSAILAIACKYSNNPASGQPPIPEESWLQIRALAMQSYFQALISKVHCLEDVQATLLLAAWGLQDRGASPDPWLLTGSGYRLSRRLGIHLAATTLVAGFKAPTAKLVASYKTYLCLYAFDRFLTVGFGRPETEGYEPSTIDTSLLRTYLDLSASGRPSGLELFITVESAACVLAYVELANISREHSRFVNTTLKERPSSCMSEVDNISSLLDAFSGRWLRARSTSALQLGLSSRPVKLLYHHIRLCLHSVALKPISHSASQSFLREAGLAGITGSEFLIRNLKKTEDFATAVVQAFADDDRDDDDSVFCYAYDYACMVLAHSAAVLLRLAASPVCGITPLTDQKPPGMDLVTAMRYCGMAITSLVESDHSLNQFPCDMAGILSLIAKESGMVMTEWTKPTIVKTLEDRTASRDPAPWAPSQIDDSLPAFDFSLFSDFDTSLQPGIFDDFTFQ